MAVIGFFLLAASAPQAGAANGPIQLVVLGDSLSAGYLLPQEAAFPAVLEKALRGAGVDVDVANAGVSGDTSRGGLERLDWAVPDGTQAVILELGANDMLRGQDPARTQESLDQIITRLKARNIRVFLAGMLAAPSLGRDYGVRYNAIFPALAAKHNVPLYPFFLEGVTGNRALVLEDGLHPNRAGVEQMVRSILPAVKTFLTGSQG
ncbi:MAG: lipolytic protein family [Hyphomicrobiales bacterium]|nr:lipolytic protein family [Hyphomicrobiales bacterium]